jgi:hypothetical protein
MRVLSGLAAVAALVCLGAAPTAPPAAICSLTPAGRIANRTLDFEHFDQRATLPSNARSLDEAGCHAEAAEATEDYLANGPVGTPGERAILAFHLAQYLAMAGDERAAARAVALARRSDLPPDYHIDWNSYVAGTRAFLLRDRAGLDAARSALRARGTAGDAMNLDRLDRMAVCFDQSYAVAWDDPKCAPPAAEGR